MKIDWTRIPYSGQHMPDSQARMANVKTNTVNFMQGFAEPFPVRVIAAPSLLNIPAEQLRNGE